MRIIDYQREVGIWIRANFGNDAPAWQPLLKVTEEIGELCHHYITRHDGIRRNEDHEAGIEDAVGDILISLMSFCERDGRDMERCLENAWAEVRQRDWTKEREEGTVEREGG